MSDEYPKMLHKGATDDGTGYSYGAEHETVIVNDAEEEASARKDGYAPLGEKPAKAKA